MANQHTKSAIEKATRWQQEQERRRLERARRQQMIRREAAAWWDEMPIRSTEQVCCYIHDKFNLVVDTRWVNENVRPLRQHQLERHNVLCQCGWGRLGITEDQIPDACPLCGWRLR